MFYSHKLEWVKLRAEIEQLKKDRLRHHAHGAATLGGQKSKNVKSGEQRKMIGNEIKKLEISFKQRTEREMAMWEMRQKAKADKEAEEAAKEAENEMK